ncbi:PEP/pyruvate-binding domain-containing protein [Pontiellaceae bacterium B1224]|nr:PEP/pyruvate-binding domain-containing protein [Pontiellaceae bacterium B1224]
MKHLFHPDPALTELPIIGGKGINLHRLQQKHPVPDWVALPTSVFFQCLESNNLSGKTADEIQELILSADLPAQLTAELDEIFGDAFVSVRSSSADEDGAEHSFAGIHESYLYVKGAPSIIDHIRKVWASGYQERALAYRKENDLPLHPVPMAVIIQRMVDAETSGVVFTADPNTRNPHVMILSALYGLGEGLVSAGLEADHIEFNKRSGEFKTTVATKETRYAFDAKTGAGICECPVEDALRNQPALSEPQLQQLAETALAIEKEYRCPQDIEFCFDASGKLFILQTRAITTVDEYGPAAGNQQVWDNSNIIESYSGVTSPMTFSFIRHAYSVVYNCFSEVMGIPRKTIEENQGVYRNMLGLFEGQVYYNLQNWYRLIQQFPGYAYNKAFMESMMGVKDVADSGNGDKKASAYRRNCIELPKLLRLVFRMLHRFMCLKKLVPEFNQHFDHYYGQWAALNFKELPPHDLMQIYDDMEKHLLRNWKTPIINDFYVMVFYGTLKGCCSKWCGDENGTLQNNLICGEGDIESTVPTRILMKLAADIKADPELAKLFTESTPEKLLATVPQEQPQIAEAVTDYLNRYGFRCMNELKLEEPSLHETPEFVYQMIANYVLMDDALLDTAAMDERENAIRAEAEQEAFAPLSGIKKMFFRFSLKHARRGVKNRENMRFARTKIYGLLRQLLNAVGENLTREHIIDASQDIYYLTVDEVWDFVKGTAVTTHLRDLIALRQTEFEGYRKSATPPDDHFETYGMAYNRNRFKNHERAAEVETENGTLRGIGCSPGSVEGIARVIHSPRDDIRLNGEILVAARTDPGWVPLYPSVSGILIERGSILSHSAIVAREMGIPAIVGIPNLLKEIKDEQPLHMDATTGQVVLKEV